MKKIASQSRQSVCSGRQSRLSSSVKPRPPLQVRSSVSIKPSGRSHSRRGTGQTWTIPVADSNILKQQQVAKGDRVKIDVELNDSDLS